MVLRFGRTTAVSQSLAANLVTLKATTPVMSGTLMFALLVLARYEQLITCSVLYIMVVYAIEKITKPMFNR